LGYLPVLVVDKIFIVNYVLSRNLM